MENKGQVEKIDKSGKNPVKNEKLFDDQYIFETTEDLEIYQTFDDIGLREDLLKGKLLQFYIITGIYAYGFDKPSAVQQRAIVPIIKGRDVIVQSQSGTGKTCVFSVGALQVIDLGLREPQVLILSPTRELAEQSQKVILALGDFMKAQVNNIIIILGSLLYWW